MALAMVGGITKAFAHLPQIVMSYPIEQACVAQPAILR